jgi:hypothetical protein
MANEKTWKRAGTSVELKIVKYDEKGTAGKAPKYITRVQKRFSVEY